MLLITLIFCDVTFIFCDVTFMLLITLITLIYKQKQKWRKDAIDGITMLHSATTFIQPLQIGWRWGVCEAFFFLFLLRLLFFAKVERMWSESVVLPSASMYNCTCQMTRLALKSCYADTASSMCHATDKSFFILACWVISGSPGGSRPGYL